MLPKGGGEAFAPIPVMRADIDYNRHVNNANGDVFEYDFGHQEAGIYFIQVVTTKGVESIRVIVR